MNVGGSPESGTDTKAVYISPIAEQNIKDQFLPGLADEVVGVWATMPSVKISSRSVNWAS